MIRTILAVMLLGAVPAFAQMPAAGSFTAEQACPAVQSIRRQTNPGGVSVEPGRSYRAIEANSSYVRIVIEGAEPPQRWVAGSCGRMAGGAAAGSGVRATHVLALGWGPAFCREHRRSRECDRPEVGTDATILSLHGLWPQPRGKAYCNVDPRLAQADRARDWRSLPEPEISPATRRRLAAVMPGLQSGLQRHEWIEHGTCYGAPADVYFDRAAGLAEQVNASGVRALFVQSMGGVLSVDAIREAFDRAFGAGAGARVSLSCPGGGPAPRIGEIVLSLAGDVTGSTGIGDLMRAASPVAPGCPAGLLERPAG